MTDYLNLAPVKITEEDFDSAFEALPPTRHTLLTTTESFLFGDKQTENIYPVYCRIFDNYFKLYATEETKHSQIVERVIDAIRI